MTGIMRLKRQAILHRQAADYFRQEAAGQDDKASEIDGELSPAELMEFKIELLNLELNMVNYTMKLMTYGGKGHDIK